MRIRKYFDVDTKGEEVALVVLIMLAIASLIVLALLPPLPII